MIQINPLKSYIDGGVRAALTTPPSASLVFDLPGKAIWVKGVKLKGTDHTYTFSHDNYITLTNTPDSNESEDIKIGVNTSALKNAIDTTYGVVSTTANGLAPKFTSGNKQAAAAATTYYFLGWAGSTLKWYQAPFRNIRINSETTDCLGVNNTDPLIIGSGNGISVTWDSTNKKIIITNTKPDINHNTDTKVAQSVTTQNKNYAIILKGNDSDEGSITTVNFSTYLKFNPSTKQLTINGNKVITSANTFVGATTSADGSVGLVTKPLIANRLQFLRGDGTWATPINTWRPVKVEGTEKLGSNALDLSAGNGISIVYNSNTKKIIITNTKPDVNHNTHYTTMLYIGENNDTKANKNIANPYLKLFDDNTRRATFQIKAGNGIAVASDANGNITITNSSPDVNHNTDITVKQTPKTDNINRPLMMINGDTSTGEQINTSMFSTGIYANASTKMITANGFIKAGSSDNYVLLGGGNHKALSDFSMSGHTHSSITIPVCSSLNGNSDVFSVEYVGGNNSVATKPSGVDAFGVMRLRIAAGWYGQIMMSANTAPGIYYRNANGLTSSVGWKKLLDSSNSSVSGGGSTWGSSITVNINGTSKTLTIPGNPNTDNNVKQSETTTANFRPLVLGYTNVSTAGSGMTGSITNQVYVSNKFYVQPSTGNLYATTFVGALSGNATTATKLQTARTIWGQSFNGTANISGTIKFNNVTSGLCEGIQWTCGDNDFARIKAGATGSNAGYLEIATADDGNEPIYIRQYTGVFSSVKRTLTLLDISGNTTFPGIVTATSLRKNGSSNSYVLLGGGGHKALSDFSMAHSHPYLPLSGGTIKDHLYIDSTSSEDIYPALCLYSSSNVSGAQQLNKGIGIRMGHGYDNYYAQIACVFDSQNPDYLRPGLAFYTMDSCYQNNTEIERMRIKANGNVGIGTSSPSYKLHIIGNVAATHFYENSDIRFKTNFSNIDISINQLSEIPLFDFDWIDNNTIRNSGTSAQAVQQVLPNLVSGTDKLTLDYGVLGTIAGITACKELVTQKSEIEQLKEKVKQLEDKLLKYENI